MATEFQSTLPAREATKLIKYVRQELEFQSTLPAREATCEEVSVYSTQRISIHASREGSDPAGPVNQAKNSVFQSTLPAREATSGIGILRSHVKDFNPRFPRGKRLLTWSVLNAIISISIHASREGSDMRSSYPSASRNLFQSTLPAREATITTPNDIQMIFDFNPRFPRGKRQNFFEPPPRSRISIHASREGSDRKKRPCLLV